MKKFLKNLDLLRSCENILVIAVYFVIWFCFSYFVITRPYYMKKEKLYEDNYDRIKHIVNDIKCQNVSLQEETYMCLLKTDDGRIIILVTLKGEEVIKSVPDVTSKDSCKEQAKKERTAMSLALSVVMLEIFPVSISKQRRRKRLKS